MKDSVQCGVDSVQTTPPRPALKLRRCAAHGCDQLVAQGYCADCAEDAAITERMVDYFPAVPGTALAAERRERAASERRGERFGLLGCVLLLAWFVWATRNWWLELARIWGPGQ